MVEGVLVRWDQNYIFQLPRKLFGAKSTHLITPRKPSSQWDMVVTESCCGDIFQQQAPGNRSDSRGRWISLIKKQFQSVCDLSFGWRFIFQHGSDPQMLPQQHLSGKHVNVLERPTQSTDYNQIENQWSDLKNAVHQWKPFNLKEQCDFEEWG